jgi:hypothetical protein
MWGRVYRNTWWQWDPSLLQPTGGTEEVERVEKELSLDYTDFSNKIAQILPIFNVFHICVIVSSSV